MHAGKIRQIELLAEMFLGPAPTVEPTKKSATEIGEGF